MNKTSNYNKYNKYNNYIMSALSYIKSRLFLTIKFNNEAIGYSKLTIPEKFKFISESIYKNIKNISRTLKIETIEFEKATPFKNIVYFTIYTKPNRNHPIIGYISRSNTAEEIILIRPIGRKRYNLAIEQLEVYLYRYKNHTLEELYGVYLSIIKSINIRKEELILNPEFSLLNCHNIKGCITATKKIGVSASGGGKKRGKSKTSKNINIKNKPVNIKNKSDIKSDVKPKSKKGIILLYRKKAIQVLAKYFGALEKYDFNTAQTMLGTSRYDESIINNVFRKTKKIRGHLEIFIVLYKLIKSINDKYNEINSKLPANKKTPKLEVVKVKAKTDKNIKETVKASIKKTINKSSNNKNPSNKIKNNDKIKSKSN